MLLSLETGHIGGGSLGNSLPKDAVNAKISLNSRADGTNICKTDPLRITTSKNNNRIKKSPEMKILENRNTVSGFYKAHKGFLITEKLGRTAVRQTQCFLLLCFAPLCFALLCFTVF